MTVAPLPIDQKAALDLAAKGRTGSPLYVTIWVLIIGATDMLESEPVIAWLGIASLTLTGLLRLALSIGFARLYPLSPARWLKAYAFSAIGLGVAWGVLNAALLWRAPFEWMSVLSSFATAGIVAGGTVSLTTHENMARVYVVAMLLPSALVCLLLSDTRGIVFGVLFLLDIAFMLVINRQASIEYWSSLRNADLLEQRAAQLELARARAEAADRAKSRFVATMSHEIRTPLNGVFGMIELLRRGGGPADQARYLGLMESSARSLLAVINDILDFSKIEAGMLTLEQTEFAPAVVVADVRELFLEAATAKGLHLVMDAAGVDGEVVLGDPTRVRQVLSNLVANAVKFTERGEIRARVERVPDATAGADTVRLRFSVSDTGIGMTPEVAARVFRAFEQADTSTTRRHGGTGLGLAICSQLVELMGGELAVHSTQAAGSTFSFEVSATRVQAPPAPADDPVAAAAAARFDGLRVLVVEDNLVTQLVVEEHLALLGCASTIADNGLRALDCLAQGGFDLVLMDCEMPELDGLETTRRWRAREREQGRAPLPVIALTANASEDDRRHALAAGMDDFLTKPFAAASLSAAIGRALPAHQRARPSPA